jgi:TetR/AcrR family transcriptional regulator
MIRIMVEHAAERPFIHQIVSHEAVTPSDRLTWLLEAHVKNRYDRLVSTWTQLRASGVAAPIDPCVLYYVLIGSAPFPYLIIAESTVLLSDDPLSADFVWLHADGIIAMLLPGLANSQQE